VTTNESNALLGGKTTERVLEWASLGELEKQIVASELLRLRDVALQAAAEATLYGLPSLTSQHERTAEAAYAAYSLLRALKDCPTEQKENIP